MTRKASKTVVGRVKELTGLSANEIWRTPEDRVGWRKCKSCCLDGIQDRLHMLYQFWVIQ